MGDAFATCTFPDSAFGFTLNVPFFDNFDNTFLGLWENLDPANFRTEPETANFLN